MARRNINLSKILFSNSRRVKRPPFKLCVQTVQKTLPIYAVHEKFNIIESYPGCYSKSYYIGNNNYQTEPEEIEMEMFLKYRAVLNSLGKNCEYAISIYNRNINFENFQDEVLKKEVGDNLDYLRRADNEIIMNRIKEGKSGIKKDIYCTIAIHAASVQDADAGFRRMETRELKPKFSSISKTTQLTTIPIEERLEILYDIYNMDSQGELLTKTKIMNDKGELVTIKSFDFDNLRNSGMTVNDILSPSCIVFHDREIEIGRKWARALKITNLPSSLNDSFFVDITNVDFNLLFTFTIQPIEAHEQDRLINRNMTLIRSKIREERSNLLKSNMDPEMISDDTRDDNDEARQLRDDIRKNDEKLFETSLNMVIWGDSKELLEEYTQTIIANCAAVGATMTVLEKQQEEGFNTTLPLCYHDMKDRRTLKSSSAATFLPFSLLEFDDPDGIVYSTNAITKNLVRYNRLDKQNYVGMILGTSGCFTGDTKVRLRDGSSITLQEMSESEQASFDIYNCDTETGEIKPSRATHARKIKDVSVLAKVTLSNGTVLKCTCDHKFLLKNLTYKEADELKPGDVLKSECEKIMKQIKVKSVEIITLEEAVGVYDIEVENPILGSREDDENYLLDCGIIVHNSGKSFAAKTEMFENYISSNADIIVIDPESEYGPITKLLGGEVVKISPGRTNNNCINPMDIEVDYEFGDETNPVTAKADFIIKLIETMMHTPFFGIDGVQRTIVAESVCKLYESFYDEKGILRPIPKDKMPTLTDLQLEISKRPEPEARQIAYTLRLYTGNGALNTFGGHTTVEVNNRFFTYDIRDIGEEQKAMAMLIILDSVWNRIVANRKLGKFTLFYVDEAHLLLGDELCANFLSMLVKRARKYLGSPTFMTQNVSDLLESPHGRKMLNNSSFVILLNQQATDRADIGDLLGLSPALLDFITSAPRGQYLLANPIAHMCVPCYSEYPKYNADGTVNPIYRVLTSDAKELKAFEEQERRAEQKKKKSEKKMSYA